MNDVRDLTPPPSPVLHVLSTLKAKGYEAWVVGGSVRDRLLGRPVNDWDITTSATPQEVSACFERVIETGIEHGTVTVLSEGIHVEVTTYRVDGLYLDGRRPSEVSFTRSLREDLARRDFTINAIAWDPTTKTLEDPFEGLADLGRELIKAVGHPLDRFREDGLRVLRAVRFAAVLGFTIEPETWAGLCGALDVFQRVAMERVQVELFKTLLSDQPEWALSALKQSQLLALICPQLDALAEPSFERLTRALTRSPAHLDVRLSLLYMPLEDPESIAHQHLTHLKCARKLTQGVTQLLRWRQVDPASERTDGQVRALSAQVGLERLPMWIAYRRAWAEAEHDEAELRAWTALEERFKALNIEECPQSPRDLALRGHELASLLNLPPSPLIGALLNALLQHVWEHPEDNTSARLLAIAPSLARSLGVESPL
jgi:tRNA nucleotidyltransferase (CCA-adding enzyme)